MNAKLWLLARHRPPALFDIAHNLHAAGGGVGILEVDTRQIMVQTDSVPISGREQAQGLLDIGGDG